MNPEILKRCRERFGNNSGIGLSHQIIFVEIFDKLDRIERMLRDFMMSSGFNSDDMERLQ